jgi:hypothetical protein
MKKRKNGDQNTVRYVKQNVNIIPLPKVVSSGLDALRQDIRQHCIPAVTDAPEDENWPLLILESCNSLRQMTFKQTSKCPDWIRAHVDVCGWSPYAPPAEGHPVHVANHCQRLFRIKCVLLDRSNVTPLWLEINKLLLFLSGRLSQREVERHLVKFIWDYGDGHVLSPLLVHNFLRRNFDAVLRMEKQWEDYCSDKMRQHLDKSRFWNENYLSQIRSSLCLKWVEQIVERFKDGMKVQCEWYWLQVDGMCSILSLPHPIGKTILEYWDPLSLSPQLSSRQSSSIMLSQGA